MKSLVLAVGRREGDYRYRITGHGGQPPQPCAKTISLISEAQVAADRKTQLKAAHARMLELERLSVQVASSAAMCIAYWEWNCKTGDVKWWGDVRGVFRSDIAVTTHEQFMHAVHPDDRDTVRERLTKAIKEHSEYEAEFRFLSSDGTFRWLLGRGQTSYDQDAQPQSMVGVNLDVRLASRPMRPSGKRKTSR